MTALFAYLRLADEFELRRKEHRNSFIFAIVLTLFNFAIVIITHQWWRLIAVAGSSPLARGARGWSVPRLPMDGDHPRSRGVHRLICSRSRSVGGSSPLARGAPVQGGHAV